MTTTTAQPTLPHRSSFARVPAVFRLQFAVRYSFIWLPIAIFVIAWAFGYGVLFLVDSQFPDRIPAQEPLHATGAAQATIWYLAFMAGYTGSHTFPFSLALSYSRRVYLMGTYLTFLVVALGYGIAAMLAYFVECATDGFGNHMYIFGSPSFEDVGGMVGVGAVGRGLFFMSSASSGRLIPGVIPILWTVIIGLIVVILGRGGADAPVVATRWGLDQ